MSAAKKLRSERKRREQARARAENPAPQVLPADREVERLHEKGTTTPKQIAAHITEAAIAASPSPAGKRKAAATEKDAGAARGAKKAGGRSGKGSARAGVVKRLRRCPAFRRVMRAAPLVPVLGSLLGSGAIGLVVARAYLAGGRKYLPSISEAVVAAKMERFYMVSCIGIAVCALVSGALVMFRRAAVLKGGLRGVFAGAVLGLAAGLVVQGVIPIDLSVDMDIHRAAASLMFGCGLVLAVAACVMSFRTKGVAGVAALRAARVAQVVVILGVLAALNVYVMRTFNVFNVSVTTLQDNPRSMSLLSLGQYGIVAALMSVLLSFRADLAPAAAKRD